MQWNPGDGSGIVDEIDSLCDSDSVAYPIVAKTRRANVALEDLVAKIVQADGTWQFDDSNYTDLPIGVANMQEGVSGYSFNQQFLQVELVQMKDTNGFWHILRPIDQQDQKSYSLDNYDAGGVKGFPFKYDKEGDTITLYPAPSATFVTLTGGLKIKFKRTASLFLTSDTTKQPGFLSPYHILVAQKTALPYCQTYKPDRVPALIKAIDDGEANLIASYANRERDASTRLTLKKIRPR